MKITHDRQANSSYIYLKDKIKKGEATNQETIFCESNNNIMAIVLDINKKGWLIGIEILDCADIEIVDITTNITNKSEKNYWGKASIASITKKLKTAKGQLPSNKKEKNK